MKKLPTKVKKKAMELRKLGYSMEEISKELNIAKSTSSIWLRNIKLDENALKRMTKRRLLGQHKVALYWHKKLDAEKNKNISLSKRIASSIKRDLYHNKIYCALLYWCEGGKGKEGIRFSNSDPVLIKTFLNLFRASYAVDEKKLKALIHLHEYHDEKGQKEFWSEITKISPKNFYKSFLKHNTGNRIKKNYQGCITIYYNNRPIAREIEEIYKAFSK